MLDCPIWLSVIIDQLLSKDPRARPFGAAAVALAFKEAEKRASEGVGVLQHATSGFSPLQLRQTNRSEAEKVLGIKPKKTRKPRELPIWESAIACPSPLFYALAWSCGYFCHSVGRRCEIELRS